MAFMQSAHRRHETDVAFAHVRGHKRAASIGNSGGDIHVGSSLWRFMNLNL